jgi:hypothetical protein
VYPQAQQQIPFSKQILCFWHWEDDLSSNSSQLKSQFFPSWPGLWQNLLSFWILFGAFKFLHKYLSLLLDGKFIENVATRDKMFHIFWSSILILGTYVIRAKAINLKSPVTSLLTI